MSEPVYRVEIEGVFHEQPGEDPFDRRMLRAEEVPDLEAAREVIADEIPVNLDSGEPMHMEVEGGDLFNIGRIYHYWYHQLGQYDRPDHWVDAWVSVERIEREPVTYTEVVPEADTEFDHE